MIKVLRARKLGLKNIFSNVYAQDFKNANKWSGFAVFSSLQGKRLLSLSSFSCNYPLERNPSSSCLPQHWGSQCQRSNRTLSGKNRLSALFFKFCGFISLRSNTLRTRQTKHLFAFALLSKSLRDLPNDVLNL
jgi:hypothetical protein